MSNRFVAFCVLMLFVSCVKEAPAPAAATTSAAPSTAAPAPPATTASDTAAPPPGEFTTVGENQVAGTWRGQIQIDPPNSTFNYVGAESGDFAPIHFRTDSEIGQKIHAQCGDEDLCEFVGVVEWLNEPPPPDASAVGRIVKVDSVRRLPDDAM